MKNNIKIIRGHIVSFNQLVAAHTAAPTSTSASLCLFAVGALLLSGGLHGLAVAQHATDCNDERFADALNAIFIYVEGTFGAMVMVSAGIGAIMSSAFGQYRASLGLLVVAVGAFVLRSLVGTFFNDDVIRQ